MKKTGLMKHGILIGNLLFSLSGAITLYTNSSFIEKTVGAEYTAIIYAISSILSVIVLCSANKTLRRYGNRVFFFLYGSLYAVSLGIIALPFPDSLKIVALVAYLFSTNVIIFSLNIFFAHLAEMRGRGNMRGFFLLLGNIGIMLGPIIGAYFINYAGFSGMYMAGLFVFALLAILIETTFNTYIDPIYLPQKTYLAIRHTLKEKTLRNVIAANFILQLFYAWMVIYTPIYLVNVLGFSWASVGIIFSVMLSPFVLLDYPLGRIADYLKSEKELAVIGFLIMMICVFALAFIHAPSVLLVGVILFFSRVGAATVEAMTEIHFFKLAKDSDPGVISLFCDLRPISYIVAPILGAIAISMLPYQTMFAVLGCILILGFAVAFYMEKKPQWWVAEHKN